MEKLIHDITLRDYFAAQVLNTIYKKISDSLKKDMGFCTGPGCGDEPTYDEEMIAMDAYSMADAMLKIRNLDRKAW